MRLFGRSTRTNTDALTVRSPTNAYVGGTSPWPCPGSVDTSDVGVCPRGVPIDVERERGDDAERERGLLQQAARGVDEILAEAIEQGRTLDCRIPKYRPTLPAMAKTYRPWRIERISHAPDTRCIMSRGNRDACTLPVAQSQ